MIDVTNYIRESESVIACKLVHRKSNGHCLLQRPSGEQLDIPGSTRDGESTQTRNNSDYSTTETGSYSDCDGNWYVAIVTSSGLGSVFCMPQVPFVFELGV